MIGDNDYEVDLNRTEAADAIWLAAPFDGRTNVWGEEVYFEVPVKAPLQNGRKRMEPGEVAYWPEGRALCVFYGPTPAGQGKWPEAISDVTPIGRLVGDPRRMEAVGDRMKVMVRRL